MAASLLTAWLHVPPAPTGFGGIGRLASSAAAQRGTRATTAMAAERAVMPRCMEIPRGAPCGRRESAQSPPFVPTLRRDCASTPETVDNIDLLFLCRRP